MMTMEINNDPVKCCLLALKQVRLRTSDLRALGNWPVWIENESMTNRIPTKKSDRSAGFDAGIACALDLIPKDRQRLSAILHANYTIEATKQVQL